MIEVGLGLGLGVTCGLLMHQRNVQVSASNGVDVRPNDFLYRKDICEGMECPVTKWDEDWDKLAFLANCQAANHYILISPGPSDDTTGQLTSVGKQIADKVVYRLAKLNLGYQSVVTSPAQRLRSTAEIISQQLKVPLVEDPSLSPVIPANSVPPTLNDDHVLHRGSQTAEAAFRGIFQRPLQKRDGPPVGHSVNIYVTSANLIRFFLCRALQFPAEAWLRFNVSKGSVSWITVHGNGAVEIRCIGEETGTHHATD